MPRESHWILQSSPHITESYFSPDGDIYHYQISPNKNLRKGDIVYLWLNYQNCFYGWGEIGETPRIIFVKETPDSEKKKRQIIVVHRKKPFDPPISKDTMKNHKHLKKLIPEGFDDLYAIPLRPGQANYINDFVREYGLEPPDGSETVGLGIEEPEPQFLMKALLKFKEKTDEGKLIEIVTLPWFDIIEQLVKNPQLAFEIPPDKWEIIIAGAYSAYGFDEVILTPRSGDYGRDIIAIKKGLGEIRIIDQVKAYKTDHLVTANDVRALIGVLQADGASKGFVTTTSDFAPLLRQDPFIIPHIPKTLELIDGTTLIKRLGDLRKKRPKQPILYTP